MVGNDLLTSISLIYAGAAFVATFALFSRQSLVIAYILLGVMMGPYGFKVISDDNMIQDIGHVGMIFLLFLAGLHLDPKKSCQHAPKSCRGDGFYLNGFCYDWILGCVRLGLFAHGFSACGGSDDVFQYAFGVEATAQ